MNRKLPALFLLLVLIFRISFGWADTPGACHHAAPLQAAAQADGSVPPCHSHEAPPCHGHEPAAPCHGQDGGLTSDGCDCGCCHVAMAMVSLELPSFPTLHESAMASPPPADLTYIVTPAHRPPIS